MTLFDDEQEQPKKRKTKAERTSEVQRCIDRFFERYEQKWAMKPLLHGGKHGTQFKTMVTSWGVDEVLALLDEFFTTRDARIMRSDYSLDAFFYNAQHLRLQRVRGQRPDDRQARNIEAAERATGRR